MHSKIPRTTQGVPRARKKFRARTKLSAHDDVGTNIGEEQEAEEDQPSQEGKQRSSHGGSSRGEQRA